MNKKIVSSSDAIPYQEFAKIIGKTPAAVRVLGLPSSLEQRHETGLRKSSKGDQGRVVDVAWSR